MDGKFHKFGDLSTDIKALVIDKLLRPSDLKNVCLVSKELHELAVKPLYRTVPLDIGSANDHRLSAFLNPRNIGLKHIRQLRLYLANIRGDSEMQMQQANVVSKMIFEFLPEDILEEFRCGHTAETWCPWKKFSTDTLLLLYRKQRKMKWLEVMDLERDILPDLKKNEKMQKELFQHTRRLALYPENRESLRLCAFYVSKTADVLEDLNVHTSFQDPLDPRDPSPHDMIETRELNDSATRPGLLTRTIFGHMMPFESCEPFKNLTSLRLQRVNLRYCADSWCKFINFQNIEVLRILQCSGADSLLAELSKAKNLPKQLRSFEIQHKDNDDNEALLALDGFLCLVSGIQDLIIDLERVATLPAAAGIARHGKTLDALHVHASREVSPGPISSSSDDQEELVWDPDDFEKICSACTSLEQLSCAWPQTSLIRAPTEEWKAFERACGSLKDLVTLQISTWPTNKPSSTYLPRPVYDTLLQNLAQRGFEMATSNGRPARAPTSPGVAHNDDDESTTTSTTPDNEPERHSKLRIIAFGISDRIYEREESKTLQIYLRSTCVAADGKTKVHATPISWCLRQYIEPRSDVLDVVLHRDVKGPPCRDMDRHSGSLRWGGPDDDDFDV